MVCCGGEVRLIVPGLGWAGWLGGWLGVWGADMWLLFVQTGSMAGDVGGSGTSCG